MQTDFHLDNLHDEEEPTQNGGVLTGQQQQQLYRWIRIALHVLLHLVIVGYFSYATYHYNDISEYRMNMILE